MKMVIYKTLGGYATTTEDNYVAPIQNARKVHKYGSDWTVQDIIDY